ncbi:hypothetical protein F2P81_004294 [Scophthalmus maximus]|uniref:Uncharacterized protein n=1 Tax=Scophthalmus maximus TaxID=52904 RepID=A0A6A4T9B8_SCOMX|nr:hypothetical protein F2P81_004294 [Scophthalmus maximus]
MAAPQRTTVAETVGIGGRRNMQPTRCAAVPPPFRIQWKSRILPFKINISEMMRMIYEILLKCRKRVDPVKVHLWFDKPTDCINEVKMLDMSCQIQRQIHSSITHHSNSSSDHYVLQEGEEGRFRSPHAPCRQLQQTSIDFRVTCWRTVADEMKRRANYVIQALHVTLYGTVLYFTYTDLMAICVFLDFLGLHFSFGPAGGTYIQESIRSDKKYKQSEMKAVWVRHGNGVNSQHEELPLWTPRSPQLPRARNGPVRTGTPYRHVYVLLFGVPFLFLFRTGTSRMMPTPAMSDAGSDRREMLNDELHPVMLKRQ